jgi:arylsulfatase A-like enzyme
MNLPQVSAAFMGKLLGAVALTTVIGLAANTFSNTLSKASSVQKTNLSPNILLILTDDLDAAEVAYMPHLKKLMIDQGISFSNYLISVSLCCPSRTSILCGQYAHNTGILSNGGSRGGFETAYRLGVEKSTIATWLQAAGYRTALFGKYLNGYPREASQTYIPPGWTAWASAVAGKPYSQFNYTLNENGKSVEYSNEPGDYGTDVYTQKAVTLIEQAAKEKQPFFIDLALYAPHQPATPAPRHANLFPDVKAPRTRSFDEEDVSDKPQYIRKAPRLSTETTRLVDLLYRRRLQSLQAVDDAITKLVNALKETNQLSNTYIVFTSDNGFHLGQHRLAAGKQTAYEEDIRVPLVIRGPGIPAGQVRKPLVGNVDLAPTFAAWANTKTPDWLDGQSLTPLLKSDLPKANTWRQMYLLEHWQDKLNNLSSAATAGTREPADFDNRRIGSASVAPSPNGIRISKASALAHVQIPDFQGIRTSNYTYVEYVTGEKELYDLHHDPDQLQNLAAKADPKLLKQLTQRLQALRHCKASACRTAEAEALNTQSLP